LGSSWRSSPFFGFFFRERERERQRERVRGLILMGVAGATPWPNGGPWGWSGHPKSHIINKTKYYYYIILILIYFKNSK
jgi:hypothetical protein